MAKVSDELLAKLTIFKRALAEQDSTSLAQIVITARDAYRGRLEEAQRKVLLAERFGTLEEVEKAKSWILHYEQRLAFLQAAHDVLVQFSAEEFAAEVTKHFSRRR